MRDPRRLKDEYENMANMGLGSADVQTASPESEKPWTSWYNNLMNSAKARKDKAQSTVDQTQVTRDDLDAVAGDRAQRNFAGGLQGAANQFLSVGGEAPKSNLNETFEGMNKAQADEIGARQKLATQASTDVQTANADIERGMKQPFEMQKMQTEQDDADPNSAQSQSARAFIEQQIGVKLPPNMSAKQLSSSTTIQPIMAKWNAERAESNRKAEIEVQDRRDRETRAFQTRQAQNAQAVTASENEKNRSATATQSNAKLQLERDLEALKQNTPKAKFDRLDPDKQETVKDLAKKNATKTSIRNQIEGYLKEFNAAKTQDEKLRIGGLMVKTLNSTEGPDAIGAEEVKRLAGALQFQLFNVTGSGPMFGRDLPGFVKQAEATKGAIDSGIQANQAVIDTNLGRTSPTGTPTPRGSTPGVKVFGKNDEIPEP